MEEISARDDGSGRLPATARRRAEALLRAGLGRAQLETVASHCAPLFWTERRSDGSLSVRNGTATFVDAGGGAFAVTAAHVVQGWRLARAHGAAGPLRLAANGHPLVLDMEARLVDIDDGIDLGTFRLAPDEVASIGKAVLQGSQTAWPPPPPPIGGVVLHCGYPGVGTRLTLEREISFGALPALGPVTAVNDGEVITQLERENLVGVLGGGVPPENFDFGGISGGPMLTVNGTQILSHVLAGIIHQGPNTSADPGQALAGFELVRARRAHYIGTDGRLLRMPLGWQPSV